jgi:RHH-type proline utilization regulon transcriptional repressor/proline dehydrogenase/delta 1-pyrroline-5-carboxylate dehydrogenase
MTPPPTPSREPAATPGALRAAITDACRRPETECVPPLIDEARLAPPLRERAQALARRMAVALRDSRAGAGGVEGLLQEFSLSSQEGVALMCLAEALLRIPDGPTRDALIRDKIGSNDWSAHLGHSPSLFVNAATWGLMVTGRLVATRSEASLSAALGRLVAKGGEPLVRKGVDFAMRLLGEQFVRGETIAEAIANGRSLEARGYRHSYDMLGEAAATAADAARCLALYEQALHAIGRTNAGRGLHDGPGISIKLSALHPRYARAQKARVMGELLPRLCGLAALARAQGIGLNLDAEESDRLELSLDLLEALCFEPALAGWDGIGFVVQAYQKRAPFVIDHLVDLARRSGHRLMVRLVKGAYWDSEVKRAQEGGLAGYPVYTRKVHTDVAYLACARRLLAAPDEAYPQFATHNAHTVAAIHQMAGGDGCPAGRYEFQCLHGMGEPLYDLVTGPVDVGGLGRPCRIYAPVGTHETLLAYLVRRLLENGANTSFVNRAADAEVDVDQLVAVPVEAAARVVPLGAPHPGIPLPVDLYRGEDGRGRANAAGIDLADEHRLAELSTALQRDAAIAWFAGPMVDGGTASSPASGNARPVLNPADHRDVVGQVVEAGPDDVPRALAAAEAAAPAWQALPVAARARCLTQAADTFESAMPRLIGLLVREAGKTIPAALSEVREAVDFLRYYAEQAEGGLVDGRHHPLGPVACISPWNFPLAIFTGQVAAALVAGNTVLAKPAEQTPLAAAEAVRVLHAAGVPTGALQLLPGPGETVGAALVADPRVQGVMFTGSTEVARAIHRTLSDRLDARGRPVTLVAETGGQNAMVVDSSALPEQVVADVLRSAFDSAGQRCSALRVLCLQEDIADATLAMLRGALREWTVGRPGDLATDIGPVIDAAARDALQHHVDTLRDAGHAVVQGVLPQACAHGSFVAPALVEIGAVGDLGREVFGPVLHVLRYPRDALDAVLEAVNRSGHGLTFGLHTRIDETVARVLQRVRAGNVYVNRNMVGAVVGVQPFGGEGLSGTGPKAGGPLYLHRLLAEGPACPLALHRPQVLPGPTGERNTHVVEPRGTVLCIAATVAGAQVQWELARATLNRVLWRDSPAVRAWIAGLPLLERHAQAVLATAGDAPRDDTVEDDESFDAVLFEGDREALLALGRCLARREGPILPVLALSPEEVAGGCAACRAERLVLERCVSTNTAAAGGNASLMAMG